jgi:hypothetical protein
MTDQEPKTVEVHFTKRDGTEVRFTANYSKSELRRRGVTWPKCQASRSELRNVTTGLRDPGDGCG